MPKTALPVCSFWYIDAEAAIAWCDEARAPFIDLLTRRNAFELLSEDIHPETDTQWGNIPKTYSTAGVINSAMRLSIKWEDVWSRA